MPPRAMAWVQIGLGLVSAITLVAYGLLAAASDPFFWLFAALFLSFIAVDAALHLRSLRRTGGDRRDDSR